MEPKMFEDIHELAENSAYLKAIETKEVSLEMLEKLPSYEELKDFEDKLRADNKLDFNSIFHEPIGFYMFKCFLVSDYVGDKALFIKDVEAYQSMRFESARIKVATLLYHRFIADDEQHKYPEGSSVFSLLQKKPEYKNEELSALRDPDEEDDPRHEQARDARLASAATTEDDEDEDDNNPDGSPKEKKTKPPPASPSPPDEFPESDDEKNESGPVPAPLAPSAAPAAAAPSSAVALPHAVPDANGSSGPQPNGGKAKRPEKRDSAMFTTGVTNVIGVYGKSVKTVKEKLSRGEAPKDLFDEVAEDVMNDLQHDVFPRFKQSSFYRKYIRAKSVEHKPVAVKDFQLFRVLGRGGFGTVYACRKIDSGALYAMKAINKKLVKMKQALDNVMEERNVLALLDSKFVTNVKYALQNEENLYLVMDLMLGGDLKYHLINAGRFTEERARFYAAEVLLGLEHIHSLNIIYRDMKLENVLLDDLGHCRLSDMGLAVITKEKIRGYAGTPGYTAPEMIRNKPYGPAVDIFSYGVMLYRMLCGAKPFKGKIDRDLDKAVVEREPKFPPDIFSPEATDLLTGLLQKRPEKRLGCGPKGIEEIKEHPFFHSIDWGLLEAGYVDPPFVPTHDQIHAAKLTDIGEFDVQKLKSVKLPERFKKRVKTFDHTSISALHAEMVAVLEEADKSVDYRKFTKKPLPETIPEKPAGCCLIL